MGIKKTRSESAPPAEPDADQSVQSVDLGEPTTEEAGKGKIQKLLGDALARIKQNPRLRRARTTLHKIMPPGQSIAKPSSSPTNEELEHLETEHIAGTDHVFDNAEQSTAGATSATHEAYGNKNRFSVHQQYSSEDQSFNSGQKHVPSVTAYDNQPAYDNHSGGLPRQEPYANRPVYSSQPSSYLEPAYDNRAVGCNAQLQGLPPQEAYGNQPAYAGQSFSRPATAYNNHQVNGDHSQKLPPHKRYGNQLGAYAGQISSPQVNTDSNHQAYGTHSQRPPQPPPPQQDQFPHDQAVFPSQSSYPAQPSSSSYAGSPSYGNQSSYNAAQTTPSPSSNNPPAATSPPSSPSTTFLPSQQMDAPDSVDAAMLRKRRKRHPSLGVRFPSFWR